MPERLRWRLAVFLIASLLLGGCDTQDQLQKQKIDAIEQEQRMLSDLLQWVKSGGADKDQFKAFVSAKTVDDLLAGLNNIVIKLPNLNGAQLTVQNIKTEFTVGFPRLSVDASIEESGVKIAASVLATSEAYIDQSDPDQLSLRVHVVSLVPVVSWSFLNFKMRGIVRDLAQLKLDEFLNGPGGLGKVSVPLTQNFAIEIPAKSSPETFPGAKVLISTPKISLPVVAKIEKIVYLADGIHVFGEVNE
jgi:hypothetical protein